MGIRLDNTNMDRERADDMIIVGCESAQLQMRSPDWRYHHILICAADLLISLGQIFLFSALHTLRKNAHASRGQSPPA